jgi:hypothetical protein
MTVDGEVTLGSAKSPARVICRYIGAHTRQTVEKRDAWPFAAFISADCTCKSAFAEVSRLTVG